MKKATLQILFLSTFLFTSTLWAEISAPVGTFEFKNNLQLPTVKKTEVTQSAARVNELKKLGWTCMQQAGGASRCWIFLKNQTMPSNVASQVQKKYDGFNLHFSNVQSVEQTNNSEFLQEYLITQDVKFNFESTTKYVLQVIKDGPIKFKLSGKLDDLYLVITDENTLIIQEAITVSHQNQSSMYLVEVNLEK